MKERESRIKIFMEKGEMYNDDNVNLKMEGEIIIDNPDDILCLKINKENIPSDLLLPSVQDGLNGLKFIEASFNSSQNNGVWTSLNI